MTGFSQRDPRWTRNQLGTSPTLTIGQAGCLITALASVLVDWGVNTDPGRLNRWLRDHGGYQDDCRLRFAALAGLGADLVALIRCRSIPAPLAAIDAHLLADHAVIIEVNADPGHPHASHWVRLLSPELATDTRPDRLIMDPWRDPGDEVTSLIAAYALPTWDASRVITAAAVYGRIMIRPNEARVISFALAGDGPVQDAPAIHKPAGLPSPMGPEPLGE